MPLDRSQAPVEGLDFISKVKVDFHDVHDMTDHVHVMTQNLARSVLRLQSEADTLLDKHEPLVKAWASVSKFKGKSGELLLVPGADGALSKVLLGVESYEDVWGYAALATKAPPGESDGICLNLRACTYAASLE